jgi:hypothetical protein
MAAAGVVAGTAAVSTVAGAAAVAALAAATAALAAASTDTEGGMAADVAGLSASHRR